MNSDNITRIAGFVPPLEDFKNARAPMLFVGDFTPFLARFEQLMQFNFKELKCNPMPVETLDPGWKGYIYSNDSDKAILYFFIAESADEAGKMLRQLDMMVSSRMYVSSVTDLGDEAYLYGKLNPTLLIVYSNLLFQITTEGDLDAIKMGNTIVDALKQWNP